MTNKKYTLPLIIKIISWVGLFISITSVFLHLIPYYWMQQVNTYANWYPAFTLVIEIIQLIAWILFLKMKKLSLYLLIFTFVMIPISAYFFLHIPIPNEIGTYVWMFFLTIIFLIIPVSQYKKLN